MVLRTSINIAPNTLQDLTIDNLDKEGTPFENYYPKVFSRADLESMIFDDIIETDVAAASGDERFTFSSTGFNTIQKTFNELLDLSIGDTPLIMTPSTSVSVLSDGTNSYAIKDAQARSDIASLQTSKVPNTRTVNGKALSSDITLTASDVGALPDSTVIPTVNNATLTIQKNGTNVQTFTANASTNVTANITVPTDTGDLTNGAGFLTSSDISNMVTTNTNQTITGKKVLAGKDKTMLSNENVTKGTNPASTQYINFGLFGDVTSSYTDRLGCMETSIDTSGNVTTYLRAYKNEASSSTAGNITVNYPASGSPYATAPTPTEDTNNSVQIDTVGARNTKLADYVDTSTNQNIGGEKTFTEQLKVAKAQGIRFNTDNGDSEIYVMRSSGSPSAGCGLFVNNSISNTAFNVTTSKITIGSNNILPHSITPTTSDNSTRISTTAFVRNQPGIFWYGTSSSAADATEKVVTITGYNSALSPSAGQCLIVKPSTTSTVADSTIKIVDSNNNVLLAAKNMRYNNTAITTSTDSVVWNANYPTIFMYDGTYWVFLAHGIDSNTTYSAMSVAEGTTGTATSSRTMRADYLKDIITARMTTQISGYDATKTQTLKNVNGTLKWVTD